MIMMPCSMLKRCTSRKYYYTPLCQTILLGLMFFLVFTAFTCIQAYSSTTFGQTLAADACSTIFLTFAIFCLVSPGITNRFGCRSTLSVGALGYCVFIICSLIYFWTGNNYYGLVILGSIVLGVSAALLWTAQGRLILEYASIAEQMDNNANGGYRRLMNEGGGGTTELDMVEMHHSTSARSDVFGGSTNEEYNVPPSSSKPMKSGTLLGIFWSLFMGSSLSGGIIAFFSYSNSSSETSSTITMYFIFLIITLIGASSPALLLNPTDLKSHCLAKQRKDVVNDDNTALPITAVDDAPPPIQPFHSTLLLDNEQNPQQQQEKPLLSPDYTNEESSSSSSSSWWEESKQTLLLFKSKRMLHLCTLFFYIGFTQPYQIETFGNRFFDDPTLGLMLMVFYSSEIVSGFLVGRLLDRDDDDEHDSSATEKQQQQQKITSSETNMQDTVNHIHRPCNNNKKKSCRRRAAMHCLILVLFITILGNIIAFFEELYHISYTNSNTKIAYHYTHVSQMVLPMIAFACWGFSDGFLQTYSYWLIGYLFEEGTQKSRAVGFYRCMQSLGWAVGCQLIPINRLSPIGQLMVIFVVFVIGMLLSLLELPSSSEG